LIVLATPEFIALLSLYFPLTCTVAILYEYKEDLKQEEREHIRRQLSLGFIIPSIEVSFEDEIMDLLRFWIVRASVQALKSLLSWTAAASTPIANSALLQVELNFYISVYGIPFLQTDALAGYVPPSKRPHHMLCKHLGPHSHALVETASGAVPVEWWQSNVIRMASPMFNMLVLVKIVDQSTADQLRKRYLGAAKIPKHSSSITWGLSSIHKSLKRQSNTISWI
jgi:hypothetical protein